MLINYISNIDVNAFSGGWSGMNHHVFDQLSRSFEINLISNVNPPISLTEKVVSKALRSVGVRGMFTAFSHHRLKRIAKEVENSMNLSANINFFHGSTPWLLVNNVAPYYAYLDCCFSTYIRHYHHEEKFNRCQLRQLYYGEKKFLEGAQGVFFSSKWALDDARNSYDIKGSNFNVAGLGGAFESDKFPTHSEVKAKPYFLFVALDFEGKGGNAVVEAFKCVKNDFPEFKLRIVGQKPPRKYRNVVDIEYIGTFDKSKKDELNTLIDIFANAFAFLLPTTKDITPLVLVEAASVGCPAISMKSFGIPEIVKDGKTGILLNCDEDLKSQLVEAMRTLILNPNLREQFSLNGRVLAKNFDWNIVGKFLVDNLMRKSLC